MEKCSKPPTSIYDVVIWYTTFQQPWNAMNLQTKHRFGMFWLLLEWSQIQIYWLIVMLPALIVFCHIPVCSTNSISSETTWHGYVNWFSEQCHPSTKFVRLALALAAALFVLAATLFILFLLLITCKTCQALRHYGKGWATNNAFRGPSQRRIWCWYFMHVTSIYIHIYIYFTVHMMEPCECVNRYIFIICIYRKYLQMYEMNDCSNHRLDSIIYSAFLMVQYSVYMSSSCELLVQ